MRAFFKKFGYKTLLLGFLFLAGCYIITNLSQPSSAYIGDDILVYFEVETEPDATFGLDAEYKPQIVGLMIPNNWQVDSVYYVGDDAIPSSGYFEFLHPDSFDRYPGDGSGMVDYWADSLEVRYPSGEDMQWVVYQSKEDVRTDTDNTTNTVYVEFSVGSPTGNFGLGYFVSNASLDFTDPNYYTVALNNPIEVLSPSAIEDDNSILKEFKLMQNYPNPFNPSTTIEFELTKSEQVELAVFDISGNTVSTLINNKMAIGVHSINFDGSNLSSGTYFYQLKVNNKIETRKMLLLK